MNIEDAFKQKERLRRKKKRVGVRVVGGVVFALHLIF